MKYNRKEFAEICGLKKKSASAYITMAIKRGKVILSDDNLIDDSIQNNVNFISACRKRNKDRGLDSLDKANNVIDTSIYRLLASLDAAENEIKEIRKKLESIKRSF